MLVCITSSTFCGLDGFAKHKLCYELQGVNLGATMGKNTLALNLSPKSNPNPNLNPNSNPNPNLKPWL